MISEEIARLHFKFSHGLTSKTSIPLYIFLFLEMFRYFFFDLPKEHFHPSSPPLGDHHFLSIDHRQGEMGNETEGVGKVSKHLTISREGQFNSGGKLAEGGGEEKIRFPFPFFLL